MRQIALNSFYQLERILNRDSMLGAAYRQFMQEYKVLGHMSRSEDPTISNHPVFISVIDNLKIRVVFEASARSHLGVSPNDYLHIGPIL